MRFCPTTPFLHAILLPLTVETVLCSVSSLQRYASSMQSDSQRQPAASLHCKVSQDTPSTWCVGPHKHAQFPSLCLHADDSRTLPLPASRRLPGRRYVPLPTDCLPGREQRCHVGLIDVAHRKHGRLFYFLQSVLLRGCCLLLCCWRAGVESQTTNM